MSFSIGRAGLAAKHARSVSTSWRDCRWAKSIAAIRTAPDSVPQPLDQGGRRKDEEAFHDVLAIEWNSQRCYEHSSTTIWCALDPADGSLQASPAHCLYSRGWTAFLRSSRIVNALRKRSACDSMGSSFRQQCVSADLFIRKDTTWTTRSCFPIPTHRNMSLRAKPPENQSNIRRFRTGPTPRLPPEPADAPHPS